MDGLICPQENFPLLICEKGKTMIAKQIKLKSHEWYFELFLHSKFKRCFARVQRPVQNDNLSWRCDQHAVHWPNLVLDVGYEGVISGLKAWAIFHFEQRSSLFL